MALDDIKIEKRIEQLDFEYKKIDNTKDKSDVMNIQADMALSAMSGKLNGGIKGQYLSTTTDYSECVESWVLSRFLESPRL